MNAYDPKKAERVWQRVQSQKEEVRPPEPGVQELILNTMLCAACCRQLTRQLRGKEQLLQNLAREEQAQGACLKGIHYLITGERPEPALPKPDTEPTERLLRRCCGQLLRRRRAYESHREDPEYGPVFRDLEEQTRHHCRIILQMLGELEK